MTVTNEALLARIAELEAQVQAAKAPKAITLKVSPKGAVSLYGMGRFPVTLYKSQWETLLSESEKIKSFIQENESQLAVKA